MRRKKKIRVGVLFGGRSGEHEVSIRSALTVISAMAPARYEVVPIAIARDGRWYVRENAVAALKNSAAKLRALGRGGIPVSLVPKAGGSRLMSLGSSNGAALNGRAGKITAPIDVIFSVLHGTYGEDGTIQGLLELSGIPYVGSGVLGSAIGMDKDAQKRLLRDSGIPVVRFFALTRTEHDNEPQRASHLAKQLGYPVFVKPNALGSSIGITRVSSQSGLKRALDDAFQYDRKILIEASCTGREFECAVLGNDSPEASVAGEVIVKGKHDFYDYNSKYVDDAGSETRIPADVPEAVMDRIREISVAAFRALSLRGMARVDFLASRDLTEIYVNEVNTIPGFTSISMYPKMWEATGLPLSGLIDRLIELAMEEHQARARLKYTYSPAPI